MATTAFCYSAKAELAQALHCFQGSNSGISATGANAAFTLTAIAGADIVKFVVGMAVTGTNVAAGAVVASIDSASQVTLSKAHTGAVSSVSVAADAFKMLLIKSAPARTFDGTQTNVGTPGTAAASATNVGTDETSGTGYTSGGFELTNITPAVGTTAGFWSFTTNPSWSSASFSATAGIIYNTSARIGHANGITANASGSAINKAISVHDFGGTQTVTSGTFTVVLPSNAQGSAILQIS